MTDTSDYYLSHRFNTDYDLFNFEKETQPDGTEIVYANKRLGLRKSDLATGINQIPEERVRELVKSFKGKSLPADDVEFNKLKVASRLILYHQLAEAYSFGLACFGGIHNHQVLTAVMYEYGLHKHVNMLTHKGRYNKWNAITALLYGEWEQGYYKRARSAEKYGCVLAMLELGKVKVVDVVNHINTYTYKDAGTGKTLKGLVAMETHYRTLAKSSKKKGSRAQSAKQIAFRNKMIARAENPSLNDAVFEMPKPDKLREAVEFGRVTFKRTGDASTGFKLLVVACEAWEEQQYQKFAFALGKSAHDEEQQAQVEADAAAKDAADKVESVAASIKQADVFQRALAAGVDAQLLLDSIIGAVGKLTEVKQNTDHLEQFADMDPA